MRCNEAEPHQTEAQTTRRAELPEVAVTAAGTGRLCAVAAHNRPLPIQRSGLSALIAKATSGGGIWLKARDICASGLAELSR